MVYSETERHSTFVKHSLARDSFIREAAVQIFIDTLNIHFSKYTHANHTRERAKDIFLLKTHKRTENSIDILLVLTFSSRFSLLRVKVFCIASVYNVYPSVSRKFYISLHVFVIVVVLGGYMSNCILITLTVVVVKFAINGVVIVCLRFYQSVI